MKPLIWIIAILSIVSCNNSGQIQQIKELAAKDSILAIQNQKKDSAIASYINDINQIQNNLDSIKTKEHIITLKGEGSTEVVAQVRALDKIIFRNNREINRLQARLRKSDKKNAGLEEMVAHITRELAEKNKEIAELQDRLAKANASLAILTKQFNDSVAVINHQRAEINAMRMEVNAVYYAVGTTKSLKAKGLIDKKGGVLGMGRTAELNPSMNSEDFTKGDMVTLSSIALNGKFEKLITPHPSDSYKITGGGKTDSLVITNSASFWSESKYLIVTIK